MKQMTGNELREAYLQFFAEKKGHLRLPSASLIPENDPTLLMIGAGMAPFKAYFTGKVKPPRPRITTSQRCVRTGDIENVGRTARHQTYFEMLGNFSFGDYFKKEAIPWAWEFLTEVLELPKDKLWATIYPKDDEARKIWEAQPGFDPTHIVGLDDNFWEIGPGPCGPDSEIYIDLGEERGCGSPTCGVGCDCDRYLEIWNNVFTQYDRTEDGQYNELENKNIDTGMGLERIASVIQNKKSNFETDLLLPIIEYAAKVSNKEYGQDENTDISLKVIADHARSMAIMIMDGILPSNEGRGYVLRRILRRAIRHGRMLGIKDKFLEGAVDAVCAIYAGASDFEALEQKKDYIKKVISLEEDRFAATLEQGTELLNSYIAEAKSAGKNVLDGALGFKLYDTFGFPWELTDEILHENDMELDKNAFDKEMQAQRDRARAARADNQRFAVPDLKNIDTSALKVDLTARHGKVVAIWKDGQLADVLEDGEEAGIILDVTPFYAEGGGQVGDCGVLTSELGRIQVSNAKKLPDGTVYHVSYVEEGQLKVGETVEIKVDQNVKLASARNHTATHLLQAALKKVVGSQVNQAGSSVNADRLRFDFSNFEPVTAQQLADVEELVNREILKGTNVEIAHMSKDEAVNSGAMALFGEKYGETVRVVSMDDFSKEFCGGTHVANTSDIKTFKILSESGVAAGVRRIEALTGDNVIAYYKKMEADFEAAAKAVKSTPANLLDRLEHLTAELKALQSENESLKSKAAKDALGDVMNQVKEIKGVKLLATSVSGVDMNGLRDLGDQLKDKLGEGVVVIASENDGKVNLIAMATDKAMKQGAHAGNLIKAIAGKVGGGGGGRPNMAQAGGKNPAGIPDAIAEAATALEGMLG